MKYTIKRKKCGYYVFQNILNPRLHECSSVKKIKNQQNNSSKDEKTKDNKHITQEWNA